MKKKKIEEEVLGDAPVEEAIEPIVEPIVEPAAEPVKDVKASFVGHKIGGKEIISHIESEGIHKVMDADGASFSLTESDVKLYVKE